MQNVPSKRFVAVLALSLFVAHGSAQDCNGPSNKLQLLHSSDHESSFQNPNSLEEKVLHYAALRRGLKKLAKNECIPSVHLTAGDHFISGSPYFQASAEVAALGKPGFGDVEIFDAMALKGNGIGNHEFDGGIDELANILATADYPFISVNLDFANVELQDDTAPIEIGQDATHCKNSRGKVVKSCFWRVGGHKVGLIGRAPADLFNVIAEPEVTTPGLDFVGGRDEQNQPLESAVGQVLEQVDLLEAKGVKRIILLDHAQDFTGDPLSANMLRGVDIIVTAGSTGFMAKSEADGPFNFLRDGDTPEADYPTERISSDGNTVLVINSDQLYNYIGHLIVEFDDEGIIVSVDDRSGPIASTEEGVQLLAEVLGRSTLTPGRGVKDTFDSLQATPSIQDAFEVIGTTVQPLVGAREAVRSRETNLARVLTDSTLWGGQRYADENTDLPSVQIALKSGGGIRDSITGPTITRLTVQAAVPFDNKVAIVELNTGQLIATMENAVSRVPTLDGRFPHLAGATLEYDATKTAVESQVSVTEPSRVKTLVVGSDVVIDNFQAQGDLTRTFVMATSDFLTIGGDGYASLAASTKLGTTEVGEQQIMEDYIVDVVAGAIDQEDPPSDPRVLRLDEQ